MEVRCFLKLVHQDNFLWALDRQTLSSKILNLKREFQAVSRVDSRRMVWLTRGVASSLPNFLKSRRSSESTHVPIQIAS